MNTLYSIGYGNRTWPELLELLKRDQCQFLIDVRSSPYSKFNPSFTKETLEGLCNDAGIRYVFMGDTLGGKPDGPQHLDAEGKIDYIKLADAPQFQFGLARLKTAHSKGLVSFLMCSELRPESCHRCKLVAAELAELGISVTHIDEKGERISQDEAVNRLTGGQEEMFGVNPSLTRSRGSYGDPR